MIGRSFRRARAATTAARDSATSAPPAPATTTGASGDDRRRTRAPVARASARLGAATGSAPRGSERPGGRWRAGCAAGRVRRTGVGFGVPGCCCAARWPGRAVAMAMATRRGARAAVPPRRAGPCVGGLDETLRATVCTEAGWIARAPTTVSASSAEGAFVRPARGAATAAASGAGAAGAVDGGGGGAPTGGAAGGSAGTGLGGTGASAGTGAGAADPSGGRKRRGST
jgi:hypothetical protein